MKEPLLNTMEITLPKVKAWKTAILLIMSRERMQGYPTLVGTHVVLSQTTYSELKCCLAPWVMKEISNLMDIATERGYKHSIIMKMHARQEIHIKDIESTLASYFTDGSYSPYQCFVSQLINATTEDDYCEIYDLYINRRDVGTCMIHSLRTHQLI